MNRTAPAKKILLPLLLLSFGLSACAHEGGRIASTSSAPAWVRRGACFDPQQKIICGVGIAQHIPDLSLATQTADMRATAKVAQELKTYTAILSKSYQNSVAGGANEDQTAAEQEATSTIKSFTKQTLRGVMIVDHYKDSDGTVYAEAQIDLATFKNMLKEYKDMNAKMKKAIEKDADKGFDELSKEEAK
ncbi:MAG: LPP20 family lipoprotein [Leptospirales bacterium]